MKQLRDVTNTSKRRFGDVACLFERSPGAGLDVGTKGNANVHLHRGQRLTDLVMQLARQPPAVLFLSVHEPRRQTFQILTVLLLCGPLMLDLPGWRLLTCLDAMRAAASAAIKVMRPIMTSLSRNALNSRRASAWRRRFATPCRAAS